MRLLWVELDRFRSRRAVVLLLLAAAALVGWLTAVTLWSTRPVSADDLAAAKDKAAQAAAEAEQQRDLCLEHPDEFQPKGGPAAVCEVWLPDYEEFLNRPQLSLTEQLGATGEGALVVLAAAGLVVGATYAGSDWSTGSLSNQLLFRPRRVPVWVAKAVVVSLGVTAAAAIVVAAQWSAYLLTAEARGIGWPSGFVDQLLQQSGRGLALIGLGTLGGFALTMLLRSTVATLAALFFSTVGGEIVVSVLPGERNQQWSLGHNVLAWLENGTLVYDSDACLASRCTYTVSAVHGAVYLGTLLVLVVTLSLLLFQRRDVA